MKPILVYVTAKDNSEASKIAQALLKKRLISCANIIPEVQSYFVWKGKAQTEKEALLLMKSKHQNFKQITKEVCKIHSYEVPCIMEIPIKAGNPAFLKWSASEMK